MLRWLGLSGLVIVLDQITKWLAEAYLMPYQPEALTSWFGGYDAWAAEFRRTAMSLAGGSGWCVLTWNAHTRSLHNYWAWDHMHGAVTGTPLIALDMYEHAYHMDYGTAAARYVDAFMANLDWEVVDARYRAAIA